jgi:hypothetical protein
MTPTSILPDLTTALPCVQCGYDLRATAPTGRCPECGMAVAASHAHQRGELYAPHHLRRLQRGANYWALATTTCGVMFVALAATTRWPVLLGLFPLLLPLALLLGLVGNWNMATSLECYPTGLIAAFWRLCLRWWLPPLLPFVVIVLVLQPLTGPFPLTALSSAGPWVDTPVILIVALGIIATFYHVLGIWRGVPALRPSIFAFGLLILGAFGLLVVAPLSFYLADPTLAQPLYLSLLAVACFALASTSATMARKFQRLHHPSAAQWPTHQNHPTTP